MVHKDIIVIGASIGGFEAFKKVVASLPAPLEASVFLVWHMSPHAQGVLPDVLGRLTDIPVAHAVHGEPIVPNRIYVAPPDHHMLVDEERVHVTHGPKENRFRPAVDPLFRSAAYAFGSRVVGVVLSGALDDGTAGLWSIKECGGTAVVQHPGDAEVPSMPENAIREVSVDYIVPVSEIGPLIATLSKEEADPAANTADEKARERMAIEIGFAAGKYPKTEGIMAQGKPTLFSCPECQGVLSLVKEGSLVRYRCHTGHGYSSESLLEAIGEKIDESLYAALRGAEEYVTLLNHIGDHFAEADLKKAAASYFRKANEQTARVGMIRKAITYSTN